MKQCTKCKQLKQATKHFFYMQDKKLKAECIECSRDRANYLYAISKVPIVIKPKPDWVERDSNILLKSMPVYKSPDITEKEIEFNIERKLNCKPNPKFFSWLCAGTNQNFIP